MNDRAELLEVALDSLSEGIALLGEERNVVFWNRAAEAITGFTSVELLARQVPEALEPLLLNSGQHGNLDPGTGLLPGRGALVHMHHKLGHDLATMARRLVLRDGLGGRIGTEIVFHPAESLDALPLGESHESASIEISQVNIKDRLQTLFEDFTQGGLPFGVLWITVDQALALRKTHGAKACEAMLEIVEQALANGLRPAEELGRWGDDEFLVVSHERTPEMLAAHAQTLAGMARTADFRWWGDKVSLTVSIGAAQVDLAETLPQLLERAQAAMSLSIQAGGNQIASVPRGQSCSPS
jgi:diguanylate cyclase (GGDEF)-like protein